MNNIYQENKNLILFINFIFSNNKEEKFLLLHSFVRILNKMMVNKNINQIQEFCDQNKDSMLHIVDWLKVSIQKREKWLLNINKDNIPKKIMKFSSIEQMKEEADKWMKKYNQNILNIRIQKNDEKLIDKISNNYYIMQLLTPEALDNESKQMQHCIGHGGYDEKIKNPDYQYLSLRDKFNKSHVTLEIKNNKIIQIQGKQNKLPEEKYLNIIVPWLINRKLELNLKRYNLIYNKIDSKIYSILNLPQTFEIDENLELNDRIIAKGNFLNCIVNGNLKIYGSELYQEKLINNININGIKINGNIHLYDSKIQKLPDNLIINGDLILEGCQYIQKLPNNLNIKRNLSIINCYIEELPQDIKIGENIDLKYSKIIKLPNNLTINGSLNLDSCYFIHTLPEYLNIKENLILINTRNINHIPNNIKIGKNIDLRYSSIKKLPINLKCEKIYIENSQKDIINNINFEKVVIDSVIYNKEKYLSLNK